MKFNILLNFFKFKILFIDCMNQFIKCVNNFAGCRMLIISVKAS